MWILEIGHYVPLHPRVSIPETLQAPVSRLCNLVDRAPMMAKASSLMNSKTETGVVSQSLPICGPSNNED